MPGRAPITALAVDDEPLAIERLQILCAALPEVRLIGTAHDGASALRLVETLAPELLLLDIAMPGMSGLELAGKLAAPAPLVIFTTAFDDHAVAAFDVAAVDYLTKPIEAPRLARALARAAERLALPTATAPSLYAAEFWVPHRGEIIRIDAAAIDYVEAERDYMRLHCGNRSFLIHETITALERRLDPAVFLRIHRSVIVRRALVQRLQRDGSIVLDNGIALPIGRSYAGAVRAMAGR